MAWSHRNQSAFKRRCGSWLEKFPALRGPGAARRPGGANHGGDLPIPRLSPLKNILIFRYSGLQNRRITLVTFAVPPHSEGRRATSRNAERDAVDAGARLTGDAAGGRRRRVVLTPRRWRQVLRTSARRWWQESPVTRESAL
jgi:hypothetical protein